MRYACLSMVSLLSLPGHVQDTKATRTLLGMFHPVEPEYESGERGTLRKQLDEIKKLGVSVVFQEFDRDTKPEAVKGFLDEVERAGLQAVVRWGKSQPGWRKTSGWDLDAFWNRLKPIKDHKALAGVVGLHDPVDEFTEEQIKEFYKLFHEHVSNAKLVIPLNFGGRGGGGGGGMRDAPAGAGWADAYVVEITPFIEYQGQKRDVMNLVERLIKNALPQIRKRDSKAQLWISLQALQGDETRASYMPTPEQMEQLVKQVFDAGRPDALFWQYWTPVDPPQDKGTRPRMGARGGTMKGLGNDAFKKQRDEIKTLYDKYCK